LYLSYQKETIVDYQQNNRGKMNKKDLQAPTCPVDYSFRRIGGKYKGRIIWYLHEHKILRYGQLRKHITDVTTKMLDITHHSLPLISEHSLPVISVQSLPVWGYLD
jgi:hypothetical protein